MIEWNIVAIYESSLPLADILTAHSLLASQATVIQMPSGCNPRYQKNAPSLHSDVMFITQRPKLACSFSWSIFFGLFVSRISLTDLKHVLWQKTTNTLQTLHLLYLAICIKTNHKTCVPMSFQFLLAKHLILCL